MATRNGGQDYIEECAANGVPIPMPVMGWPWTGRFPEPSTEIFGWCATVLAQSVQTTTADTMPPDADHANYQAHINELLLLCQYPDSGRHLVGAHFENDPNVLSAPTVVDPLFACAERVSVKGGVIGAELSLYLNGHHVATKIAHDPDGEEFVVPALKIGNILTASQKLATTVSAPSAPVSVQDHKAVYAKGLPVPAVDPGAAFQCASVAAVRHVPGARITLFTNDAFPSSRLTSTGWSTMSGGSAPFVVNDALSAEQSLCGEVSKRSRAIKVGAPPEHRPEPKTPPGALYGGQQVITVTHMVNGASGEIRETGGGLHPNPLATFSSPVTYKNNVDVVAGLGRNLAVGDQIEASYRLCPCENPRKVTSTVKSCTQLWAPKISTPHVGDTSVTVAAEAVPGARIRIYDAGAKEIGDGSGVVINLTRALTGSDVITAVEEVGTCTSQSGWQTTVN